MKTLRNLLLILVITLSFSGICNAQNKIIDESGNSWQTFTVNELSIFLNVNKIRKMGKYLMLTLVIQNSSDTTSYTLDFDNITIEREGRKEYIYTQEEFERRLLRRSRWNRFGVEMAAVATAVTADVAFSHTSLGSHHHHNFGKEVLRELTRSAIQGGVIAGDIAYSTAQENKLDKIFQEDVGYLKNYIIKPQTSINGFAYAKFRRSNNGGIVINLPISGTVFSFTVNPSELLEIE